MILKARPYQFATVLERQSLLLGGEAKLFLQVILRAFEDIVVPCKVRTRESVNREALSFFYDGRMDLFADRIGLNPDYVREQLQKAAPGIIVFTPLNIPQQPAPLLPGRSHSGSIGRMVGSNSGAFDGKD